MKTAGEQLTVKFGTLQNQHLVWETENLVR